MCFTIFFRKRVFPLFTVICENVIGVLCLSIKIEYWQQFV